MIQLILSYLIYYGLTNNIVTSNSSSVTLFQREKKYTSFRYLSVLFILIGIAVNSFITYFLSKYIYAKFDMGYIGLSVVVMFVGVYNLFVAKMWSKMSNFKHYLYESSYAFVMDFAFMLSVITSLDYSLAIADFAISVLVILVIIFVMNVLIGFFVEDINRSYINIYFRNVPARLFLLAIFAIILHYVALIV